MGKFKDLLDKQEIIILDGALGTELESLGYDVSGKLWSAQYLLDQPQIIQDVHESYVRAGSDIITTSSYQASIPAFIEAGLTPEKGYNLLKETVFLAQKAIENVWTGLSPEEQKPETLSSSCRLGRPLCRLFSSMVPSIRETTS